MIENHFGKPGSGKSYSVMADVILPALKSGCRVLTNIDGANDKTCRLRLGAALGYDPDELEALYIYLSDEDIKGGFCWSQVQAKDVFVIDEAQRYWPGGALKATDPVAFKFFGEHRHYGCTIHCITINPGNYQAPMRSYAEVCHLYKKLGVLGLNSRYTRRDYASAIPSTDSQVGSTTGRYSPEIFTYYKSVSEAGNLVISKQKNILLRPKMLAMFAIILLLAVFSIYRVASHGIFPEQKMLPSAVSSVVPSAPSPLRRSVIPSAPSYVSYTCIPFDTLSLCFIRLSDGSSRFVRSSRLPGGLIYDGGTLYLPGGKTGGRDDD